MNVIGVEVEVLMLDKMFAFLERRKVKKKKLDKLDGMYAYAITPGGEVRLILISEDNTQLKAYWKGPRDFYINVVRWNKNGVQ